jgi:tubulin--tyrosine ligase
VVDVAIKPFFGLSTEEEQSEKRERMALALDIDLGRN